MINDVDWQYIDNSESSEVQMSDVVIPIKAVEFESKVGWGTSPVRVDNKYLMHLHSVDRRTQWYNVFTALIDDKKIN